MRSIAILVSALFFAGCAYSPQQIQIQPNLGASGEQYGAGRVVSVMVDDARENKVIGSRGGVYADTSTISVANSMTDAIAQAAKAKLAAQGFSVNSQEPGSTLKLVMDKLDYIVTDAGFPKSIGLSVEMRALLERDGKSLTTRYKTDAEHTVLKSPSAEKNAEMINGLISDTMQRIFADEKVKDFLAGDF